MAPQDDAGLTWCRPLDATVALGRRLATAVGKRPSGPLESTTDWCSFELADAMEQGFATQLTTAYVEVSAQERQLLVQRSKDRREYLLQTEDGGELLLARAVGRDGMRFDVFVPSGGDPPCALGPAFSVTAEGNTDNWVLRSLRCEVCSAAGRRQCGQRELMRVTHYREKIGEGQTVCADVDIPELRNASSGDVTVWCSACNPSRGGRRAATELTTRRPSWNPKMKALALDFRGRCTKASVKNFQLENEDGDVVMLYGKIEDHLFVLDVKSPLSMVQAFAASLTSSQWK